MASAQPEVRPGASLRLLIVEDSEDTAWSTATVLREAGFEVDVAHTGPDALRLCEDRQPDAVLLDIGLPGMNGLEVARRLRRMPGQRRPLLVAVTGYGDPEVRRQAEQAGIDLFLLKPVPPSALTNLLQRFERIVSPGP